MDRNSTCYLSTRNSYLLVPYKETSKLFFAPLFQLIMSLLSFKVNAEFKGCEDCLQSIGWLQYISFAVICFLHFRLIFISIDKVKLIHQCPGDELSVFNFSSWLMLKLYTMYLLDDAEVPFSDLRLIQHWACFCSQTVDLFCVQPAYKTITTFHVCVYLSAHVSCLTTPSVCF